LIISFFGLAFNEFIILYFWGLEKETHLQIIKRSANDEKSIDLEILLVWMIMMKKIRYYIE
jgi:hypothetical protein